MILRNKIKIKKIKKYQMNLTDEEYSQVIKSIITLKNNLIEKGSCQKRTVKI